jgi:hypothetical protein
LLGLRLAVGVAQGRLGPRLLRPVGLGEDRKPGSTAHGAS